MIKLWRKIAITIYVTIMFIFWERWEIDIHEGLYGNWTRSGQIWPSVFVNKIPYWNISTSFSLLLSVTALATTELSSSDTIHISAKPKTFTSGPLQKKCANLCSGWWLREGALWSFIEPYSFDIHFFVYILYIIIF